MNIELQSGETRIDTWAILYTPPGGKEFNGKLAVTSQRLIYQTLYDAAYNPASLRVSLFNKDKDMFFYIKKSDILNVNVQKSFLSKKVLITLNDGSAHEFNYGALSVDKLVAAITS